MQAINIVFLPDNTVAFATRTANGIETRQRNLTTGGWRVDSGWTESQLRPVLSDALSPANPHSIWLL